MLGLVAGCLGLTRSEEAAQTELAEGLGLGLRREGVAGPLLTDYHTAQTQASRKGRRFATRREELRALDPETVLSRRDYRSDCAFTRALWRRPAAALRWSLDDLAAAMRAPRFIPYFGQNHARSACRSRPGSSVPKRWRRPLPGETRRLLPKPVGAVRRRWNG